MFNHCPDHRVRPLSKSPRSVYYHRERLHSIAKVARPVDWARRQHQRHSSNTKFHLTIYHGQQWRPSSLYPKQFLLLFNPNLPNQSKRQNSKLYHYHHHLTRTMRMNVKSTPPNQTKHSKSTHQKTTTITNQKRVHASTLPSGAPASHRDAVEQLAVVIPSWFARAKWPRFCIGSVQQIAAPFAPFTMIQTRIRRRARRFGFTQRTRMMMLIIYRDYWIRLWMIWTIVILIPNKLFVYKKKNIWGHDKRC